MGMFGRATTVVGAVKATKGRHPLGSRLLAVPPMLRDAFSGRWPGAPKGRILAGLAGILYVLSPIDLMPEVILGPFGIGDDLALAVVAVAALLSSAEDWLDRESIVDSAPADVIQGVVVDRP